MEVKVMEHRKALGLSQTDLTMLAGIGQHTVSDIETGAHIPRVDVAIFISRALNTVVEELFIVESGQAYPL